MFGYVRAREDSLTAETKERYQAIYCGLCHTIRVQYGKFARLFLNYDFVFLAMLLAPSEYPGEGICRRCVLHPVHGRPVCGEGRWMELAAGESVVLTYWKLRDTVADSGFFEAMAARLLCQLLKPAYRKAKADFPNFDSSVSSLLDQLRKLEKEGCSSIDQTADCFAQILCAASPDSEEKNKSRILRQLLYHLGRWIYLIDAVDDLSEDKRKGRYNPVGLRFPQWTETDQDYLRSNLDRSLGLIGAAFQLLDSNAWTATVENIIYSGLPSVEELVFSGQWQKYRKKHRRNRL